MAVKRKPRAGKPVTGRIPFDQWINSPLSIARHYGGCEVGGKMFLFDPEQTKERNADGKYTPDLVTYD